MRVLNVHRRVLAAPMIQGGELVDHLGSRGDLLWPNESWPRMRFDRELQVHARGGHGPVRYEVLEYEPGRRVVFGFERPRGFHGTHAFELLPRVAGGCELVHTLDMHASGRALLAWALVFGPLHDALLEDAMDRASAFTGTPFRPAGWGVHVHLLRAALRAAGSAGSRRHA
jgi:uncharacterized protein YndB with AHSA1/START domain